MRAWFRFAAGLAVGVGLTLWWARRPAARVRAAADSPPERRVPETSSHHRHERRGRIRDDALIDGAVEDTFPASDPPAFMQSVIVGPPRHEQREDVEEEFAEAHPS